MNYYEKHIGDYIKDTVSLSMLEDGAYNRLIDQAYQTEAPLPLEIREIYRLARATSGPERKAVDYVLGKFWQQTPGGYVQKRIQAEIDRYQDKQRKAKASADARWNKVKPQSDGNANASADAMRTHSEGNAHQTPDTRHQSPDLKPEANTASETSKVQGTGESIAPTLTAGAVSQLCRRHGVMTNSGDPRILKIVADGIGLQTIEAALQTARDAKPKEAIGIGYIAGILTRWAADAAALNVRGAAKPNSSTTNRDQSRAAAAASIGLGARHDEQPLTFDAETGRVAD